MLIRLLSFIALAFLSLCLVGTVSAQGSSGGSSVRIRSYSVLRSVYSPPPRSFVIRQNGGSSGNATGYPRGYAFGGSNGYLVRPRYIPRTWNAFAHRPYFVRVYGSTGK